MPLDRIAFDTTDHPTQADVATIDAGLDAFNRAAARFDTVRPLACIARNPADEIVGGAIARTWGQCCEIQQLWVRDDFRRRGVGRRLIEEIAAEAIRRGCLLIYLETFSFQASAFYQRLGFETACEFAGFPNGFTKRILRRTLDGFASLNK